MKYLFFDSNIFLKCILEEDQGLNLEVLKKIKNRLESKDLTLLLPEVVKHEVLARVDLHFAVLERDLREDVLPLKTYKNNNILLKDLLEQIKRDSLDKVSDFFSMTKKNYYDLLSGIFSHGQTVQIPIEDEIILRGIKRSLKILPPFKMNEAGKKNKPSHTMDRDCMAIESLVFYANKVERKVDLIFCTDDPDYYSNIQTLEMLPEIKNSLSLSFNDIFCYSNPLVMMDEQLDANEYSEQEIKSYDSITSFVDTSPAAILPADYDTPTLYGSSFCYNCGYRLGSFGNRNVVSAINISYNLSSFNGTKYCPRCGVNLNSSSLWLPE